jgi:hypothetical protein
MLQIKLVGHTSETHSVILMHHIHIYSINCNSSKLRGGGKELDSCQPGFKVQIKIKKEEINEILT